jgi:hypothetical protein
MLCDCGHDSSCFTVNIGPRGPRRVCRNCRSPRVRESVFNPYADLTMEHVHGDDGRPLHVSSLRELRDAEKRHAFKSLVANENESDFQKPPQHREKDLFERTSEAGNWLFPDVAEGLIREMRETGEL